jgi:hypothetical protein
MADRLLLRVKYPHAAHTYSIVRIRFYGYVVPPEERRGEGGRASSLCRIRRQRDHFDPCGEP